MSRRKKLTADEFAAATAHMSMSVRPMEIARRVLVDGHKQKDVAADSGLTAQTVNDHVQRVWKEHVASADLPPGTQRVSVVLSREKAQIVLQWAHEEQIQRLEIPTL